MIAGIVLAAGAGRRFGGPKQLADFGGRPLLERPLAAMAAAPLDRVVVVLGAEGEEVLRRVDLHGAEPVIADRWWEGQAASLRAALDRLPEAEAVVVVLGDQPLVSAAAIARVLAAREADVDAVRATYAGRSGHPVVLERRLFPALRALRGDAGARDLLRGAAVLEVPCDGLGRPDDVDTRHQLEVLLS